MAPPGDDGQTLCTGRLHQSFIERDKRNRFSELLLKIQATRNLDGVAGSEGVSEKQRPGVGTDLGCHLYDDESWYIAPERGEHPIALPNRERPSRARRTMADETSTSERRLLAAVPDASNRRTVVLPVSRT
jgi:hypothetical protein